MLTVATVSVAGCGDAPTVPSPGPLSNQSSNSVPLPTTTPIISGIEIEGPEVLPVGQTLQYALIARLTDGTRRDVTNEGTWTWTHSWGAVVRVEGPGQLRGDTAGEGQVEARLERYYARKNVTVLPAGTYRITGRIVEEGFSDDGVVGAMVEAQSGSGRLVTHTDLYGYYRLYGVAGATTLRVSNPGYEPAERTIVVDRNQNLDITLPLVAPRAEVAGTYTLAITAARSCRIGVGEGALPEDAVRRVYAATITQNGPALNLLLTGERPVGGARGWIEPARIVFDFNWNGYEPYRVEEELGPSRSYLVDGVAVVNPSAQGLSGRFAGELRVAGQSEGGWAWCKSADHEFVLTR